MSAKRTVMAMAALVATCGAAPAAAPPDSAYVRVDADGHLALKGERQRYWGVIGGFPHGSDVKDGDSPQERERKVKAAYAEVDALVERFVDLGFNLNRMWHGFGGDYVKGDGSYADVVDYYVARMKARGLRLWAAGINRFGKITPADVGVVDDPATADEWQAAMRGWNGGQVDLWNIVRKWDQRFEALAIERRRELATHMNHHTGLRWSDDPVFVAWELSNEEWWFSKMVGGQWRGLPEYWQRTLIARWNEFLRAKYRDDARLKSVWKTVLPGESLERGTVQILPLAGDQGVPPFGMDEQGLKQLTAARGGKEKYSRRDFSRERGEDVMAFFVDLFVGSKRREAEALKTWGKSCRISPLAWDTGIGYEIQAQYVHQQADVSVHDAYVNGWGWEQKLRESYDCEHCRRLDTVGAEAVAANRGPWNCWVLKPPGIAQGVPWLEHNRVEGKPYFCYETQIQQPAKYRADFPLRLGMLASVQDWDVACWHYYAPPKLLEKERPFDRTMDVTVGGHPQGYHYTFDEIQTAMMRAVGIAWRSELLASAPRPTKFVFGRRDLHDPDSMDYGHSYGRLGLDMNYTVYQYGVRIEIDPSREVGGATGPRVSFDDRNRHNPYTPTKEITYDWKRGGIVFDAPGIAGFAGFLPKFGGRYCFKMTGATLSDVEIANPPGIYDPMPASEGYVGFALYSEDGQPLARSRKAAMSLVSTSFNSEFSLARSDFEKAGCPDHPLARNAPPNRQWGKEPVLVARVGARVRCRALDGMRYTLLDWHMKPMGSGTVRGGAFDFPADKPVFVVRFER